MAIDFASMMLNPSPVVRMDLGNFSGGGPEREKLRLMREQFEETKRSNREDERLRQEAQEGLMARERMMGERQAAQAAAERAAETQKSRLAAQQKFGELNASGDIEGARAMVPMMTALGMGVDLEGEEGGLPRYRIEMDAEQAEQQEGARAAQAAPYGPGETAVQSLSRLGALGYPGSETGNLDAPAGIASSDETDPEGYSVAERVASTYGEPGEKTPMAQPDAPDLTGGVPKNVIDMGAMQSQTLARLDPAMSGIIAGLPQQYRDSARSTASGIRGMGLPAGKAFDTFTKAQGDANTLIKGDLDAEREQAKAAYAQRFKTDEEGYDRFSDAYKVYGKELADSFDVTNRKKQRVLNTRLQTILTNPIKEDDMLVLGGIVRGLGEVGAPSNADANRAIGIPATSTWDQVADWITSRTKGGMPEHAKRALTQVMKDSIAANDAQLSAYGEAIKSEWIDDPATNADVRRGMLNYYRSTVPIDLQNPELRRGAKAVSRGTDDMAGTETGEVVIPESARIAKAHNNPGNLKFVDQDGATKGEAADDGGSWAKFETPEAGLQALREQIELDAGRGQTVREFVTKYAPPESNDTETYIKQAAEALRASPDDPLSEVDTYDVLRFVANKESGTQVPDQHTEPAAEAMGEQKAAEGAITQDADARRARLAELRKKYGKEPR